MLYRRIKKDDTAFFMINWLSEKSYFCNILRGLIEKFLDILRQK